MSAQRALFAAPAATRAARDGRAGAVELVLAHGAYLRLGGDWLLVSEPSVPLGPLSIAVDGLGQLELAPGLPAAVRDRRLLIGDTALSLERMRTRRTLPPSLWPPASAEAIETAAAASLVALPAAPMVLERGLAALQRGAVTDAVGSLAGLGPGLTPAGDDVLAGYAASRVMLRRARPRRGVALDDPVPLSTLAADRSSALGLAYLSCAERGEVAEPAARLLSAIHSGSAAAAQVAAGQLRAWGASSGTAIALGILAATLGISCRVN